MEYLSESKLKQYSPPDETELKKLIYNRITELKKYKLMIKKVLDENIELKNNHKKPDWQNKTLENNIRGLRKIINDINKELRDNESIKKYCLGMAGDINCIYDTIGQINPMSILGNLANYSITGSIIYDLNWLTNLLLTEKINIAMNRETPDILDKHWQKQCDIIEYKIQLGAIKLKSLTDTFNIITEAINIAKKEFYISSNLTLIAVCESLTRYLATNLYYYQNSGIKFQTAQNNINKIRSLERVILNKCWKNDLEYPVINIAVKYGYIEEPEIIDVLNILQAAKNINKNIADKISEISKTLILETSSLNDENRVSIEDKTTRLASEMQDLYNGLVNIQDVKKKINLRIKLHFLIRRFKEDRNAIVHGNFKGFDKRWKNYVYLSAVEKILDSIEEYDNLYGLI